MTPSSQSPLGALFSASNIPSNTEGMSSINEHSGTGEQTPAFGVTFVKASKAQAGSKALSGIEGEAPLITQGIAPSQLSLSAMVGGHRAVPVSFVEGMEISPVMETSDSLGLEAELTLDPLVVVQEQAVLSADLDLVGSGLTMTWKSADIDGATGSKATPLVAGAQDASILNTQALPSIEGEVSPVNTLESASMLEIFPLGVGRPQESAASDLISTPQNGSIIGLAQAVTDLDTPPPNVGTVMHPIAGDVTIPLEGVALDEPEALVSSGYVSSPLPQGMSSGQAFEGEALAPVAAPKSQALSKGLNLGSGVAVAQNEESLNFKNMMQEGEFDTDLSLRVERPSPTKAEPSTGSMTIAPSVAGRVSVPVDVQFGKGRWGSVVAERTAGLVMQNVQTAQMQLDPPELGPLTVKIHVQNDQASVSFVATNAVVKDALDQTMPRLKDLLGEQGLELVDASVSDQSQKDRGHDEKQEGGTRKFVGDTHSGFDNQPNTEAGKLTTTLTSGIDYFV